MKNATTEHPQAALCASCGASGVFCLFAPSGPRSGFVWSCERHSEGIL